MQAIKRVPGAVSLDPPTVGRKFPGEIGFYRGQVNFRTIDYEPGQINVVGRKLGCPSRIPQKIDEIGRDLDIGRALYPQFEMRIHQCPGCRYAPGRRVKGKARQSPTARQVQGPAAVHQDIAVQTLSFKVRSSTTSRGIKADDRVSYKSKLYDIIGIEEVGRNAELVIVCKTTTT